MYFSFAYICIYNIKAVYNISYILSKIWSEKSSKITYNNIIYILFGQFPIFLPLFSLHLQMGCILFCLTPQKFGQITDWGKKIVKGDKKGGEMHIFFPISKKYTYFFPNWLKIFKIEKKADNFRLWRAPLHYNES